MLEITLVARWRYMPRRFHGNFYYLASQAYVSFMFQSLLLEFYGIVV
jgi:hypothetical protein